MNARVFILLAAFVAIRGFGQGMVNFANITPGVNAPIRDATLPGTPLCEGNLYQVQLYIGPPGALDCSLLTTNGVSGTPTVFLTSGNLAGPGYFLGSTRRIPVGQGSPITLQVRAWRTDTGANWETALVRGESNLIQVTPLEPPLPPANLIGLQSFNLSAVPEPGAWALLTLGSAAFWCAACRRRK